MNRRNFFKRRSRPGRRCRAATALAAPAIAQANPKISWRMTSSFPKSLDTIYGGAEDHRQACVRCDRRQFHDPAFAAGEIVPACRPPMRCSRHGRDAPHRLLLFLRQGSDLCLRHGHSVRPQHAACRMPGVLWRRQGPDERVLCHAQGLFGLAGGNTGAQMGGWFRKEINTLDDLKGVKMRIGGFAGQVMSKLGVMPQQIAGGDIYPALEKGTIDAAEWVGPYDDEKLGFHKVAKYYYYPGWWEGGPMLHAMVNLDKWNELPKPIRRSCDGLPGRQHQHAGEIRCEEPGGVEAAVAEGAKLRPFSQEIMEAASRPRTISMPRSPATNPTSRRSTMTMTAFT